MLMLQGYMLIEYGVELSGMEIPFNWSYDTNSGMNTVSRPLAPDAIQLYAVAKEANFNTLATQQDLLYLRYMGINPRTGGTFSKRVYGIGSLPFPGTMRTSDLCPRAGHHISARPRLGRYGRA
jgi:hypothetical protein